MSLSNEEIDAIATSAKNIASRGAKLVMSGDQKVEFFDPKTILDAKIALQADDDSDGCFHSCTFAD